MPVDAVTLNFNDIDGIHGRYRTVPVPAPYIPGMEVLGTVDAVGAGVDRRARRHAGGRRSRAARSAGTPSYAVAPATMTFAMPDEHSRYRTPPRS